MKTNHKYLVKFLLVLTMVISTVTLWTPTTTYAKSYPKHSITIESKKTKITKKKVTVTAGQKIALDKIKYGTRVGKTNSNKYKYVKVVPNKVKWVSYNKNIATVNKQGVVTAKKAGKTVIKGTYKKLSYKITVTVKAQKKCSHTAKKTVTRTEVYETITKQQATSQVQWVCQCRASFNDEGTLINHQVEKALNGENGHGAHDTIQVYITVTFFKGFNDTDCPDHDVCTNCGKTIKTYTDNERYTHSQNCSLNPQKGTKPYSW